MNKALGARVRELREARNITQQYMADRLAVSRQKYARIESGANSITLDLLSKIAELFSVRVADITCMMDKKPPVFCRNASSMEPACGNRAMEMLELFYANKHLYERITTGASH